jgi:hypothetical protein
VIPQEPASATLARLASGPGERVVSDDSDDKVLDFGFFARVAGIVLGIGILCFIGFAIFIGFTYAWGIGGAFLVLIAGLIIFGLIYDRTHQPRDLDVG